MTQGVGRDQRHLRAHPCPVCAGGDDMPRDRGVRCSGFTSIPDARGRVWIRCTREEHAGALPADDSSPPAYRHLWGGACRCGVTHAPAPYQATGGQDIEAIYDYRGEDGTLLYQVVRKFGKRFLQRRPDPGPDGWVWRLGDVRRVLYRLPELVDADRDATVYVVEGEKDALNGQAWLDRSGLPAGVWTTNAGGAGKWPSVAALSRTVLEGRAVVVVADADAPGRKHARQVADALRGAARTVTLVEPPEPHKDFSDVLAAGLGLSALVPLVVLPVRAVPPPPETPPATDAPEDDWRARLLTSTVHHENGRVSTITKTTLPNIITFLRYHEDWRDLLGYDSFAERVIARRVPPWDRSVMPPDATPGQWQDVDTLRTIVWLAHVEGLTVGHTNVANAAIAVASTSCSHPVRDYLRSVTWDRRQRLPTWLADYCTVSPSTYASEVGRRWMISAVARVQDPGCQVDCLLVMESLKQGRRKSSAFRALVPNREWQSETGVVIGDKDSYQNLHGVWIYVFDELGAIRKGDLAKVKNFLTSPRDRYRPPYGHTPKDFLRQNVFAGTVDSDDYLTDRAGNRRYWPVRIRGTIDVESIARDRDQLWAEALVRYESGERWYVDTPELQALCEEEQVDRVQVDVRQPAVAEWLSRPTERVGDQRVPMRLPPEGVTTAEVLLHCLGKRLQDITVADGMAVAEILRSLGYERGPQSREHGTRVRRYRLP